MDRWLSEGTCESLHRYPGRLRSADNVTMLRLGDGDDLEETLQECENMEVREAHAFMGSSKFRQRVAPEAAQAPAKSARAVRAIHVEAREVDQT